MFSILSITINHFNTKIVVIIKTKTLNSLMKKIILFTLLTLLTFFFIVGFSAQSKWTSQMDALAHQTEQQFGLPHGLCRAEALQESGYDTNATREEGGYFNQGSR